MIMKAIQAALEKGCEIRFNHSSPNALKITVTKIEPDDWNTSTGFLDFYFMKHSQEHEEVLIAELISRLVKDLETHERE